jgi:hypothetical protein
VAGEPRKPPRKARSKSKRRTDPPKPPDAGKGDGHGRPDGEDGEAVEAHAEFVARHFGGGVQATPEVLDRAIEVWQRLPGAVVRSPAQIRPNRPSPPPSVEDNEDKAS